MDSKIIISKQALLPIVRRHFQKLSPSQWSMLAAGTRDSATEAMLAELIAEMLQTLSTAVLKVAKPIFEEFVVRGESEGEASASLDNLKPCLGDSLAASFAEALQISHEKCENADMLTELIEMEVLQKVNSIVSVAHETSNWPSAPAVFISGSMANIKTLRVMVFHATKCLTTYLERLDIEHLEFETKPWVLETEVSETQDHKICQICHISVREQFLMTENTDSVIKRLSDMLQDEVDICSSDIKKVKDNMKEIIKAVTKDLHRKFGSSAKTLKAALVSDDISFYGAVAGYVQIHVDAILYPTPKKSKVARFFSALGKAMPFRFF